MELRFGKFPEHHPFLLITRPFVEWSFKYVGWLIIAATIDYARVKTHSVALFILEGLIYLLILGFSTGFVDWMLSFQFNSRKPARKTGRARRGAVAWIGGMLLTLLSY